MRSTTVLAIPLLLASSLSAVAQKPHATGKTNYARVTGKGTPADLSHHKDNSDAFLRGNVRNNSGSALNKIEQESLRSAASSSAAKRPRVQRAVPKVSASKTGRNVPMNFSGHAAGRGLMVTNSKAGARSPAGLSPKPH